MWRALLCRREQQLHAECVDVQAMVHILRTHKHKHNEHTASASACSDESQRHVTACLPRRRRDRLTLHALSSSAFVSTSVLGADSSTSTSASLFSRDSMIPMKRVLNLKRRKRRANTRDDRE